MKKLEESKGESTGLEEPAKLSGHSPPFLPCLGLSNSALVPTALLSCRVIQWECRRGPHGDCDFGDRSERQQAGVYPACLRGICCGGCSSRSVQQRALHGPGPVVTWVLESGVMSPRLTLPVGGTCLGTCVCECVCVFHVRSIPVAGTCFQWMVRMASQLRPVPAGCLQPVLSFPSHSSLSLVILTCVATVPMPCWIGLPVPGCCRHLVGALTTK